MENLQRQEALSPYEFRTWQGLFRGFIASANREQINPYAFTPYTLIDFSLQKDSMLTKLSARADGQEPNSTAFPRKISIELRYRKTTIVATGEVIWQDKLPLPQSAIYSTPSNIPRATILGLINTFGGILEQPMEYNHRGLRYRR